MNTNASTVKLPFDYDMLTQNSSDKVINLNNFDTEKVDDLLSDLSPDSIVYLDSNVLTKILKNEQKTLKEAITNGNPIVVSGDSTPLQSTGISTIVNPNAVLSSIYFDVAHNTTYCYGIEVSDDAIISNAQITEDVTSWIDSVRSNASTNEDSTNYDNVVIYNETKICSSGGKIHATGIYSFLGNSNGFAYYSIRYNMESIITNTSWGTADMTVECDVDSRNSFQHLIDYGPDTTAGTVTTGLSVNLSAGTTGLQAGSSVSWQYTVPEVTVHNECDSSEDLFKIWHDTNEERHDTTTRVQPGAIVSVNQGSQYMSYDNYIVQYEKPYESHFWPWDPTTELKQFTLTAAAVLVPPA